MSRGKSTRPGSTRLCLSQTLSPSLPFDLADSLVADAQMKACVTRRVAGGAPPERLYRPTAAAEASIERYDGLGPRTGDMPIAAERSFFFRSPGNCLASESSKYVIADTVVA